MKNILLLIFSIIVIENYSKAQDLFLGYQFAGNIKENHSDIYPIGFDISYLLLHKIILESGFSYGAFKEDLPGIEGKASKKILNFNVGYLYKKIGVSLLGGIQYDNFNGIYNSDESTENADISSSNLLFGGSIHFLVFKKLLLKATFMNIDSTSKIWLSRDSEYQIGISYRITKL